MEKKITNIFILILSFCMFSISYGKLVEYNLDIDYKIVNFANKNIKTLAINNQIPAPLIKAREGDILRVTFNNKLDEETSIHWHGILLPNDQDGVPYLTTMPIRAHTSFTYEFPIIQSGTYWYHSHTNLQEQQGLYGPLVFLPKTSEKYKEDLVIMFSDWSNENSNTIWRHLKIDDDYYSLKKDTVQSWLKVLQHGKSAIKNRLKSAWTRMGPMDVSDVGYDAFLVNGSQKISYSKYKKGDKVLLRLINGSASTYFNVEFAGGSMEIIAADGLNVKPIKVEKLKIAIAETYDVLVTLPKNESYELRATAVDGSGYSSTILGSGKLNKAPDMPKPNLFVGHDHHMMMNHKGHNMSQSMDHSAHSHMEHMKMAVPKIIELNNYKELAAPHKTTLPKGRPERVVNLELTGFMEGYVWSFNNKTLSEADKILIKKGENVKFVLDNKTMMNHPIHLHGHFFRVLNGQGDYSPLKHTVDVPAMSKVEIEFAADEKKDWFFHCHNLYHMKSGMARVVRYEGTVTDPKLIEAKKTDPWPHDDTYFFQPKISVMSNKLQGMARVFNTKNTVSIKAEYNYKDEYDIDLLYSRRFTRHFYAYAGGNFKKEHDAPDDGNKGVFGFTYVLPLLIHTDLRVDTNGHVKFAAGSDLQLTDRFDFEWEVNTDKEYEFMLNFAFNKKIYASVNYSSDLNYDEKIKFGAGITVMY